MERDEKMNVWIRGNKTNPKGVIKALEKLEGKNPGFKGRNDNCIYFINACNIITNSHISSVEAHCIMNTFKEVKPEVKLKDKQLVWAWDDDTAAGRNSRFYDAKNNCVFYLDGNRNGDKYANYEPYEGKYPNWAKKAVKQLKD